MTDDEIDALSRDDVLRLMRAEGIQVVHSMFATIHNRSDQRPDGFTDDQLDEIAEVLQDHDLIAWKKALKVHLRS